MSAARTDERSGTGPPASTTVRTRALLLSAVILAASFGFRLLSIDKFPYWYDEAYTVWFSSQSYHDLWTVIPTYESHPPLYYSLVRTWRLMTGDSIGFSARYLSLVLSLVLIPISWASVRALSRHLRTDDRLSLPLVVALMSTTPFVVWYSIEARPYAVFALSFLIAVHGAVLVVCSEGTAPHRAWALLVVGAALTCWSHSLGALYTAGLFGALAAHGMLAPTWRRQFAWQLGASTTATAILTFPVALMVLNQLRHWKTGTWLAEPTMSGLKNVAVELYTLSSADPYIFDAFGENVLSKVVSIGVKLTPLLLGLFGLWHLVRRRKFSLAVLFAIASFSTLALTFAISRIGPHIFLDRTLIPGLMPYYVLVAISVSFVRSRILARTIIVALVVLAALGGMDRIRLGYKEAWPAVAETVINRVGPGDVLLLMPNGVRLPLEMYDPERRLSAAIRSIPAEYPAVGKSDFYPVGTPSEPGMTPNDLPYVRDMIAGRSRVFLLMRVEDVYDPTHLLTREIGRELPVQTERRWGDIVLYQFSR